MAIPNETLQRFDTAGGDETSVSRLVYWQYGMEVVREHPAFGIGFGNWVPYIRNRHPDIFVESGRAEVIHNTYLEVATEQGLIGFTIYVGAILYMLVLNVKTAGRARKGGDKWLSATASGLIGGLLVYLVTSFFMSVYSYPYFWIFLVMSAICASSIDRASALPRGGARRRMMHRAQAGRSSVYGSQSNGSTSTSSPAEWVATPAHLNPDQLHDRVNVISTPPTARPRFALWFAVRSPSPGVHG